jgi:hypothetical protein
MIRHMVVLLLAAGPMAGTALAQELAFLRRTAGYGAFGLGGGNFTLDCAAGCPGELSARGFNFELGRHFSQRWRLDFGAAMQSNSGDDVTSRLTMLSVGSSIYLVGGLHVRGAGTWMSAQSDSVSSIEHRGGPGYLVGAGYDLHFARTFALTPYVNLASGTVKPSGGGAGGDITVTSLNFGVNLSSIRGVWECTTAAGERVRVTRGNRTRALACLNAVAQRLGRRPSGIKY